MKKYLLIIRHADALNDPVDHERNLSSYGKEQAQKLGNSLREQSDILSQATWLVSSAKRTQETFKILASAYSPGKRLDLKTVKEFYNQHHEALLDVLYQQDDSINVIAMIAHNPGVSELGSILAGEMIGFDTAKGLLLSKDIESWSEISEGAMEIVADF